MKEKPRKAAEKREYSTMSQICEAAPFLPFRYESDRSRRIA